MQLSSLHGCGSVQWNGYSILAHLHNSEKVNEKLRKEDEKSREDWSDLWRGSGVGGVVTWANEQLMRSLLHLEDRRRVVEYRVVSEDGNIATMRFLFSRWWPAVGEFEMALCYRQWYRETYYASLGVLPGQYVTLVNMQDYAPPTEGSTEDQQKDQQWKVQLQGAVGVVTKVGPEKDTYHVQTLGVKPYKSPALASYSFRTGRYSTLAHLDSEYKASGTKQPIVELETKGSPTARPRPATAFF
jgi:hypothetical protein